MKTFAVPLLLLGIAGCQDGCPGPTQVVNQTTTVNSPGATPTPVPLPTPSIMFSCRVTDGGSSITCTWQDGQLHTLCLEEAMLRLCTPGPVASGFAFDAEQNGPPRFWIPMLMDGEQRVALHTPLSTTS